MTKYEHLYDEMEKVSVRYIGLTTEMSRYDFALVYTGMFFGKTLVVDVQTGRSALLCDKEVENTDYLRSAFNVSTVREAEELSGFFKTLLPGLPLGNQY